MNNLYKLNTPEFMEALCLSSVSVDDARQRGSEYAKMFSRNAELQNNVRELGLNNSGIFQKQFSGYAETPILSNQYFNASVASYVSSFAGYMSIERDFEHPNGIFYWFDVLGVTDLRPVITNLGPDYYQDINVMGNFTANYSVAEGQKEYYTITGRKILPGTVRIKIERQNSTSGNFKVELVDNGQGVFMATPGIIEKGEINYMNGTISFTLTDKYASAKDTDTIIAVGKEDVTGTPSNTNGASNAHANDKRFIAKMQQLGLNTVPDLLVGEYNISTLGAMKKSTGSDMASFLFTRLRELYTKCINNSLVRTLEDGYTANDVMTLDLSVDNMKMFSDYRSRIDLFDSYLVDVETALASKGVKTCNITAYVAGKQACNQFQKGSVIGKWEPNTKLTYINDLLGWYNGIPVLRSTDIVEDPSRKQATFYAIHKTQDGQMAPLARGIFMPLTDTPTVGNYNNPTQMASGIYYQEGTKYMAPELVQKVTFTYGL